jgi:hypothetical protein
VTHLVIPTYFYPPKPYTASNRIASFANYISEAGVPVTVITSSTDFKEIATIRNGLLTIIYLPEIKQFRFKASNRFVQFVNKIITFIVLLFQNLFLTINPYKNIISYAVEYIGKLNVKPTVLISGQPFELFKIGYKLSAKNIKWIADYRDGWTVANNDVENIFSLAFIIKMWNGFFEKKWMKTASTFITVSPNLKEIIEEKIKLKGHVVYNGFVGPIANTQLESSATLNILYSGEIYKTQDFATFIAITKKVIDLGHDIRIKFQGSLDSNFKIDSNLIMGYENNFIITSRIPLASAYQEQEMADAFLLVSYGSLKGIASSKVFDYLRAAKQIILFKNDHDVLEELLVNSNLGKIANSNFDLENILISLAEEKKQKQNLKADPNLNYIKQYSRDNQSQILLNLINSAI